MVDTKKTLDYVEANWNTFVEGLQDFVRVPNLSLACSSTYLEDGLVQKAFDIVDQFVSKLELKNLSQKTYSLNGKAGPLRIYTIDAHKPSELKGYQHVMLYGHLDKQPWGADWDTSPTDPVIIGDKMMGRGSSDDGYAAYMAFMAIKNLQEQDVPTPKFTIFLESEEESGSPNILALMDEAKEAIGEPEVIFILDSGTLDYRSLWVTATMRGIVNCDVEIDVLKGGVHSGVSGGIVPEPHRIMRMLMDRIENVETGEVLLPEVSSPVPKSFEEFAQKMVNDLGDELWNLMPFVDGCQPINHGDNLKLYLRNTWHAATAVIGFKGLPETKVAGNAMNPKVSFRVSTRISPDRHPDEAADALVKAFTQNPPYNAKITANANHRGHGYNMKPLPDQLAKTLDDASKEFYGPGCRYYGLGATIPLLTELQLKFPNCIIIATGVLGPDTNAHGPNESINLPYTKKFMGLFSTVLGSI